MHDLSTTLVAAATPPGRGGVGCIRISGPDALEVARRLFRPAGRPGRMTKDGLPLRFGRFLDPHGNRLDHGYLVLFEAVASFTGEPTAELWSHGSPAVLSALIAGAIAGGAQPAGPGEFTYRALRNGRLDLPRAEAVRDLVAARTTYQARLAFAQAEGAISRRLAPLRESLEQWIARGEAAIEFVDESETHLPSGRFRAAIAESLATCRELLRGYSTGRIVRDGATLAIVGLPNVGKSSLFNRLLARDRAIVADLAGTTRDTLEEQLELEGIPLRLIDTAGLRQVEHPVESEGVRRAERARAEADLVLLVLDGSRAPDRSELEAIEQSVSEEPSGRTVIAVNKSDLAQAAGWPLPCADSIRVSALNGSGIDRLRAELRDRLVGSGPLEDPIVTNSRHALALDRTAAALERAAEAQDDGWTEEWVLEDLKSAMDHLGTITGEFSNEDLYDKIFSTFCIGK